VAGIKASPHLADKIQTGLLLSLWESLSSMRVGRGGDDGACAATLRAYFECLLHGWQTMAQGGADKESIEALTTAGLLPVIDALLAPDGRGGKGVPGGRGALLSATVKCTELLCSREELAATRSCALKVVESRLLSCRAVHGGEDTDAAAEVSPEEAAEEARELSALVCAFKRDGAGAEALLPMMAAVCRHLQARCWGPGSTVSSRLPQLELLADVVSHWGVRVLSEGTEVPASEAAATVLRDSVVPVVSSTLEGSGAELGMDRALPEHPKKILELVFRLAGLLLVEQPAGDNGEIALWTALLESVGGGGELPSSCARVEAVALLVSGAGRSMGPAAQRLVCHMLDSMVRGASVRLLMRQGHSEEPGMLLSARLHELILAVLPHGARAEFLISESILVELIQRLTRVMDIWTGAPRGQGMEDESLVDGASVTAAMSSAAMAGLDTVECVLSASQTGTLPSSCSAFVIPILSALFHLRVHSEDMIGAAADARDTRHEAADRPLFDHDAQMASKLRSRTGLRASSLWDSCARGVLIDTLRREGGEGLSWLLDRATETRVSMSAAVFATQALVLADQAMEIVSVARECEFDVTSILGVLLSECVALPQGSSTLQHAASMWLAFGLRFLYRLDKDTVIAQLESEISRSAETAPLLWLVEELVLAYGASNSLKPSPSIFSRSSADQAPCVWSHAAVSDAEDDNAEAASYSQPLPRSREAAPSADGAAAAPPPLPDVVLAWSKLVTPILAADAGATGASVRVSTIARHLALKCARKTLEGCVLWPRALGHLLAMLSCAGGTKYLHLCADLLGAFGAGEDDALLLQGMGAGLVGKARLMVVMVKTVAELVSRSEAEVQKSGAGDTLLYCNGAGGVEEVELLAVHREEFPPFFSIRMADRREKQTEAHRLSSIPWLATVAHECGTAASATAELISTLRGLLKALALVCARYILENRAPIGAAMTSAQGGEEGTRAVASLVLLALRELCRCRQHYLMGSDLWLQVLEASCGWFDTGRQHALPSPESSYMLAATAGLVTGGHHVGLDSEVTGYRIADSLGGDPGAEIDANVVSYWLAQLAAEPNGGCVRALCTRPAAWAQVAARVHVLIVSKVFWGSAAQGLAMQVLMLAEAYAVVPAAAAFGPGDTAAAVAGDGGVESEDEVIEVKDDDDDDEEEVIEILDDEEEEGENEGGHGQPAAAAAAAAAARAAGAGAGAAAGSTVDAQAVWERSRCCGFAHVLGELIAVRDIPVAGLAPQYVSRVRLLATVAAATPKEVRSEYVVSCVVWMRPLMFAR